MSPTPLALLSPQASLHLNASAAAHTSLLIARHALYAPNSVTPSHQLISPAALIALTVCLGLIALLCLGVIATALVAFLRERLVAVDPGSNAAGAGANDGGRKGHKAGPESMGSMV